ncbi:shikimate kinase [Hoyosella rhizosphaerae]|uniref:Shikimate kinase n=1 Tax=Hoyosella rhizosphaerae TaxID=1755582 RepID=A0A916XBC0_9ACTN|nr:shikimate kinase [Hoyosella rhizosphaerae]MBN4926447.1 shikimate kinase [Hoyosella rhizosphaerae]GGC59280.1 shikimate kinase [Hoyosella rhizosphaerae]
MAPRAVLVGPPGAGKSTIGRRLASALKVSFFDTDVAIERETGRSIPEIFATDGESGFRAIEEDVVARAIAEQSGVVSLGGGAVLSPVTQKNLSGVTVIYLEISVAEGLRRTGANNSRPLLVGDDPSSKYRELMRIRRPIYRNVASMRVRTEGRSPGRVVQYIVRKLESEKPRARWPNSMRREKRTEGQQ